MPLHVWLFDAIVSLAAASFALLAAASLVVGMLREPARRVRVIELTLVGLALLPLLTLVPGYPRWFPGRGADRYVETGAAEALGGESTEPVNTEAGGERGRECSAAASSASSV